MTVSVKQLEKKLSSFGSLKILHIEDQLGGDENIRCAKHGSGKRIWKLGKIFSWFPWHGGVYQQGYSEVAAFERNL